MRESGGRSKHSGTVVKKKTSSGCLVIKKKGTDRFSDSSSRNLNKFPKEKKRGRVVGSDSESSDRSGGYKRAYVENGEFETNKRGSGGLDVFEFDEYDGFGDNMIRKDGNDGRYRWNLYRKSGVGGSTSRFEVEDDESDLPLSVLRKKYRLSSGKAIRLQGKNGVLKR
ncbi:hypothetical protein L1987_40682 [Smallanthus sonchifolius]|uniref:Uncharacterized protein n=1 Tax=Smallanthus sonchifolius TaxID=185202 RepID=A0ACB9GUM0_9ASTR|nr:hypothetical protein L1987_40682 [Smallanthus sonchifolius]